MTSSQQVERLKDRGFDRSSKTRGEKTIRVACSQCQALVINGVACHEHGCPNQPRKSRRF